MLDFCKGHYLLFGLSGDIYYLPTMSSTVACATYEVLNQLDNTCKQHIVRNERAIRKDKIGLWG